MAITLSHGGPTIYRSPAPSRQVLVGTIEGVVCIERDSGGSGWHVAHRTLTDKHIHALLIEPESGTIFAGASHGSIFASADGGQSWERRDEGLTQHNVYSLECARRAGGVRIFAGTEPAHLYCSDDLGRRWTELVGPAIGGHVPVGIPRPAPHRPHEAHRLSSGGPRHPVHRGGAGRPPEEHGCGTHVPGDPGNGRRRAPHGDRSAERRPDVHHDGHRDLRERRRRQDVGATDRPAARDRRLSRSPGAPSETAGAAVRRVGRERSRGLVSQTTTRAPASPGARTAGRPGRSCAAGCPTACGPPSRRCVWRTGGHRSRSSPRRRPARCGAATTAASSGRKS